MNPHAVYQQQFGRFLDRLLQRQIDHKRKPKFTDDKAADEAARLTVEGTANQPLGEAA